MAGVVHQFIPPIVLTILKQLMGILKQSLMLINVFLPRKNILFLIILKEDDI